MHATLLLVLAAQIEWLTAFAAIAHLHCSMICPAVPCHHTSDSVSVRRYAALNLLPTFALVYSVKVQLVCIVALLRNVPLAILPFC